MLLLDQILPGRVSKVWEVSGIIFDFNVIFNCRGYDIPLNYLWIHEYLTKYFISLRRFLGEVLAALLLPLV